MRQIDTITTAEIDTLYLKGMLKRTRASQLAALADKVYEASEPEYYNDGLAEAALLDHDYEALANEVCKPRDPAHAPGELDYLDDQPQAGGPDTWTDSERNL